MTYKNMTPKFQVKAASRAYASVPIQGSPWGGPAPTPAAPMRRLFGRSGKKADVPDCPKGTGWDGERCIPFLYQGGDPLSGLPGPGRPQTQKGGRARPPGAKKTRHGGVTGRKAVSKYRKYSAVTVPGFKCPPGYIVVVTRQGKYCVKKTKGTGAAAKFKCPPGYMIVVDRFGKRKCVKKKGYHPSKKGTKGSGRGYNKVFPGSKCPDGWYQTGSHPTWDSVYCERVMKVKPSGPAKKTRSGRVGGALTRLFR